MNGELPKGYISWVHLALELKKASTIVRDERYFIPDRAKTNDLAGECCEVHRFSLDYVYARAFEELGDLPERNNVQNGMYACRSSFLEKRETDEIAEFLFKLYKLLP